MSQSPTSGDVGVSEARRLDARLWQFPPHERPPDRPGAVATRMLAGERQRVSPPRKYTYAPAKPVKGRVPVQTAVDRSELLEPTFVDIEIINEQTGTVIQILRYPVFGPYGSDPNDAAWFSERVNPRTAICSALAPYAAARCLAGMGYW